MCRSLKLNGGKLGEHFVTLCGTDTSYTANRYPTWSPLVVPSDTRQGTTFRVIFRNLFDNRCLQIFPLMIISQRRSVRRSHLNLTLWMSLWRVAHTAAVDSWEMPLWAT